jgi:plasmid replication initiation protein
MKNTTVLNLSNAKVTLRHDSAIKKHIALQLEDTNAGQHLNAGYAHAFFTLNELNTLINVLILAKDYFTEEMNNDD